MGEAAHGEPRGKGVQTGHFLACALAPWAAGWGSQGAGYRDEQHLGSWQRGEAPV